MFAAAHPDAVSVCVLQDAQRSNGLASRAVVVDSRSFGTRPVAYFADCDHHYDVFDAADDSAGGHGSGAAEDDECHDAGDAGPHELESAGWVGLVLVRGAVDWDRTAVGNEPDFAGTRDAGDDGEAGAEEREIAVSCQLSAISYQLRLAHFKGILISTICGIAKAIP